MFSKEIFSLLFEARSHVSRLALYSRSWGKGTIISLFFMYVCMHVCIYVCVLMCVGASVLVPWCVLEVRGQLVISILLSYRTGFLVCHWVCQASWPLSYWVACGLHGRSTGLLQNPLFYMGPGSTLRASHVHTKHFISWAISPSLVFNFQSLPPLPNADTTALCSTSPFFFFFLMFWRSNPGLCAWNVNTRQMLF